MHPPAGDACDIQKVVQYKGHKNNTQSMVCGLRGRHFALCKFSPFKESHNGANKGNEMPKTDTEQPTDVRHILLEDSQATTCIAPRIRLVACKNHRLTRKNVKNHFSNLEDAPPAGDACDIKGACAIQKAQKTIHNQWSAA